MTTSEDKDKDKDLDAASAARAFGHAYFNLLRRGADGSLTLSTDHWRLQRQDDVRLVFEAREPEAPPLDVPLDDIQRLAWDRLPRQQARSQIRVYWRNGDIWTFSGHVDESALAS
ncbi:MAG: hypothetical protein NVSMB2_13940 [Chloroflexota bacterium]